MWTNTQALTVQPFTETIEWQQKGRLTTSAFKAYINNILKGIRMGISSFTRTPGEFNWKSGTAAHKVHSAAADTPEEASRRVSGTRAFRHDLPLAQERSDGGV